MTTSSPLLLMSLALRLASTKVRDLPFTPECTWLLCLKEVFLAGFGTTVKLEQFEYPSQLPGADFAFSQTSPKAGTERNAKSGSASAGSRPKNAKTSEARGRQTSVAPSARAASPATADSSDKSHKVTDKR